MEKYFSLNEAGKASLEGPFAFTAESILSSFLPPNKDIPHLEYRRMIFSALCRVIENRKPLNVSNLRLTLKEIEKKHFSQPTKKYFYISMISLEGHSINKPFPIKRRLEDVNIKISRSLQKNHRRYWSNTLSSCIDLSEKQKKFYNGYCYFVASCPAKTRIQAHQKISEQSDLLLGIWNLRSNHTQFSRISSITGSAKKLPINKLALHPLSCVLGENEDENEGFWFNNQLTVQVKPKPMNSEEYKELLKWEKVFRKKIGKNSFGNFIGDLIINYMRAASVNDLEASFLALWTLLEKITGSFQHFDIIKKLISLMPESELELHHLKNRRNNIVHDFQTYSDSETIVFQLNQYITRILIFMVLNAHRFETKQKWIQFLELPRDKQTLEANKELINFKLKLIN